MTWINKCRKAAVTHALENDLSWRDLTLSNFIWRRGVWAGRQLERRKVKWLLISFLFFFFNMYRQHARHQGCICGSQLGLYIRIIQGGFQEKCLGHALRDSDEIAWERDPGICNSINIIHHGQAGFISGMKRFFSICKSISVIHHINKLKNKIHRIISVSSGQSLSCVWLFVTPWTAARQASLSITNSQSLLKLMSIESVMEKTAFDEIQHPFTTKTLQKVGIEGTYLNIIKTINDKATANIIFNGEKLKAFLLKSGTGQGCPLLPLLFNIILGVLATAIRQEKEKEPKLEKKKWML